jgi:hypothetical protein
VVAKGFSFVLVTVVMVMMLVFGLLSLSSSGADLRLSRKAAAAQQIYYGLDSSGEQLSAACNGAAAAAEGYAAAFISDKQYLKPLPSDFYNALLPLVNEVKSSPGGSSSALLERGVFFYDLEKQLGGIKGNYGLSFKVDQKALAGALAGKGAGAHIAYVYSTIRSSINPADSLNITLVCDFGGLSATPAFSAAQWESAVSGLEVGSGQKINVWDGN